MYETKSQHQPDSQNTENNLSMGWMTGTRYFQAGLRLLGINPWLYVKLLTLFALPAIVAATMTVIGMHESFPGSSAIFLLNAISSSVAPVVIMVAVATGFVHRDVGILQSIQSGLRWLPRYLWTNAHTTVMFWVPIGSLVLISRWQKTAIPLDETAGSVTEVCWYLGIAISAAYIHSRTLLAPFLAVHENMPGTLAALESWRLSGRYFSRVFSTFIISSSPAAIPLGILIGGLLLMLDDGPQSMLFTLMPSLTWVAIKFIRPFLVTATYLLYKDLWQHECWHRAKNGQPGVPPILTPLVKLSAAVPRFAGRIAGRDVRWSL